MPGWEGGSPGTSRLEKDRLRGKTCRLHPHVWLLALLLWGRAFWKRRKQKERSWGLSVRDRRSPSHANGVKWEALVMQPPPTGGALGLPSPLTLTYLCYWAEDWICRSFSSHCSIFNNEEVQWSPTQFETTFFAYFELSFCLLSLYPLALVVLSWAAQVTSFIWQFFRCLKPAIMFTFGFFPS